ncbi:hypothetical protein BH10BDE1_BH10BDE1_31090 [soil metagenome]
MKSSFLLLPVLAISIVFSVGCGSGSNNVPAVSTAGAGTGVGGAGRGPSPVVMGSAGNYAILAKTAVTSVPSSPITGSVGLSPASGSFMGAICSQVQGSGSNIYVVDAAGPAPCAINDAAVGSLTTAVTAMGNAETDANSRAKDYNELSAGLIGGLNLGPASYKWTSNVLISSTLYLTGGPDDVWIFQTTGTFTMASGTGIVLLGGALPQNIYWSVAGNVTLNSTSSCKGTIISHGLIAMKTNAVISGSLLADSAVTLDMSTVTKP